MNGLDLRSAADWIRQATAEHAAVIYGVAPGARAPCPLHGGADDPNFAVHDDGRWSCYSRCGHGDLITWIAVREHEHPVGTPVRGELFRRVVLSALERMGKIPDDFPATYSPESPDRKGAKPYPAREELDALLAETTLPIFTLKPGEPDRPLAISGRVRPGVPSVVRISGLDLDGPGLVRVLHARSREECESGPEWCRTWRKPGLVVPTYDGKGRLVSVEYRPDKPGKLKGIAPSDRSAGPLFLNPPARELLSRDASVSGLRVAELARERGVLITEGLPGHLGWCGPLAGPVIGLRGGNVVPRDALLAIPRDAPVFLDFDPDAAGSKYLRSALVALREHTNVQWSARMAWYAERFAVVHAEVYAARAPKRKEERDAADREVAERIAAERAQLARELAHLRDADEVDGGPELERWGFTPIPQQTREEASGRSADGTWRDRLRWDDKGLAKSTGNALLILQNDEAWSDVLAYDERKDELQIMREPPVREMRSEHYPRPLRDADETWMGAWIEGEYGIEIGANKIHAALVALAEQRSFDRVREYLIEAGKRWDGVSRLDTWLVTYLGAVDTPLNRAIGAKWMIGAVARALRPGCKMDNVLVLEGPQGVGKSRALAALCAEESWFTDQVPDLRDQKAAAEILQGPWIVELAELAALNRAEVERVKAFITTQRDRYRSPWGKIAQGHPRRCAFAASTNADAYLKDPTGARRWWPVKVGAVNVEALLAARGQLWAEAVVRFQKGESWYLDTAELTTAAEEAAEERYEGDAWEELILPYLAKRLIHAVGKPVFVSMQDLLGVVKVEPQHQTRAHETRIGAIMRTQKGWQRSRPRVDGERVRGFVPIARRPEVGPDDEGEVGPDQAREGQPEVGPRRGVGPQVGPAQAQQKQGPVQPVQPVQPTYTKKRATVDTTQNTQNSRIDPRVEEDQGPGGPVGPVGPEPFDPAAEFSDDDGPIDPLVNEMTLLAERWASGVGPRPGWPFAVKDRWRALFRELREAGETMEDAGRTARDRVEEELAAERRSA